jgi:hypothetical protein
LNCLCACARTEAVLGALVHGASGEAQGNVTFGVALPAAALAEVPPAITRAAAGGQGDLLLIERPSDPDAWRRLLAGASLLITTGRDDELLERAAIVGLEVEDGQQLLAAKQDFVLNESGTPG